MRNILHRILLVTAAVSVVAGSGYGCKALDDAKSVYKGEAGVSAKAPAGALSRVNAVQTASASAIPDGWCEKRWEPGTGPKLELPDTAIFNEGPINVAGRSRWINMWATWCKPCVAEIPLIMRWRDARLGNGTTFSLEMLSVDEDLTGLKAFLARHMELRRTRVMQMKTPADLPTFAATLGLGADTTVPIHIFTDGSDNITCVRTGGIAESDLGAIRELMK